MARVEIYIKRSCPFCIMALRLLADRGVDQPDIIRIDEHPERRPEMIQRAHGRSTVPQIFIDGQHIGGCDDLHELDAQGRLVPLLSPL